MPSSRSVAGLCASLVLLTGCVGAASSATPEPRATQRTTSTTTATTAVSAAPTTAPAPATTQPPPATAVPSAPPGLVGALAATWQLTPQTSCLMVTDGRQVVFERNPDSAVVPASTMKLLTATAVLERLDPSSRLSTTVVATAPPDAAGVVNGDVWVVGGGDPVLGTQEYREHFRRQPRLVTPLEQLADRIAAAGVRRVTGRLLGDDGRYDRQRYVATWPSRYVADDETGPLSALSVNDGFERWSPSTEAFADPAAGAASVLSELLRQRGVQVDGGPGSGAVPSGTVEITSLASPTIAELVASMLLDSDNNTAELLVRELGLRVRGSGSTDAGRQVAVDTLRGLGLPMDGTVVADGSGLDPGNRVTCRLLVATLASRPALDRGLPIAAQTGTLYKRFLATPVAGRLRAKTGSIRSVASLAGFAMGANGRTMTFAYVQNGVAARQGMELQDRLGHDLVLSPQ